MKKVEVTAKFPDVIEHGYEVMIQAAGEASNFKAAVSRAIGVILKDSQLKRKRIKKVLIEVAVSE